MEEIATTPGCWIFLLFILFIFALTTCSILQTLNLCANTTDIGEEASFWREKGVSLIHNNVNLNLTKYRWL